LKLRYSRARFAKAASALALGLLASVALVPSLASGAGEEANPASTVFIKLDKQHGLHFAAPKTIVSGEELEILNKTDPHKVGPHTFSLVTKGSLPKTRKARQRCFTPKHICMAIARWHGFKRGKITINPAEAGLEGWDTMGNLKKKGDSWFTGEKPRTSFTQKVTAAPGTTITFMCAVHAWMHGSIEVLPPAGP
jgi:hypothetical protein